MQTSQTWSSPSWPVYDLDAREAQISQLLEVKNFSNTRTLQDLSQMSSNSRSHRVFEIRGPFINANIPRLSRVLGTQAIMAILWLVFEKN
jgi:hypothetical protein